MNLSQFDFELPETLIAQHPPERRDGARMLVVHRDAHRWDDRRFDELPHFLRPGDCLVLNDSKVFPSRLFGEKTGVKVEVFLLRRTSSDDSEWEALVRPGRRIGIGDVVQFGEGLEAEILARGDFGHRTVRFRGAGPIEELLERLGHVPLPPYIKRSDEPADRERYQTVFA
ncbi:MAG: S-adenosylmethionine:tRNA ribosyltransferase-isomerase, partial [Bryobacteraceae bacterium]